MNNAMIAPIKDFDGYFVTSDGKVIGKQKKDALIPSIVNGYKRISLVKDGKVVNVFVHRLVATTFIPNPNNFCCINHKDENKLNNDVSNLEWCTIAYNNGYGTKGKRTSQAQMNRPDCSKPVSQYDKSGNYICTYQSLKEASRKTGIHRTQIARVCDCKPMFNTAGGYKWGWA